MCMRVITETSFLPANYIDLLSELLSLFLVFRFLEVEKSVFWNKIQEAEERF